HAPSLTTHLEDVFDDRVQDIQQQRHGQQREVDTQPNRAGDEPEHQKPGSLPTDSGSGPPVQMISGSETSTNASPSSMSGDVLSTPESTVAAPLAEPPTPGSSSSAV